MITATFGGFSVKKIAIGVAVIAALMGRPALAADMAVKAPVPAPIYSWTGFYAGLDGGGAWATQTASDAFVCLVAVCGANAVPPAFGTLKGSDFIGGLYAGYNFMLAPKWLVGIEGDWSGTHLNDTTTAPQINFGAVIPGVNAWSRDVNWLASLRGRLGFTPTSTALLYITGGAAWARTDYSAQDVFVGGCPNCGLASFSQTQSGYVIGGGGEWAPWSNNWLLRAEYLYYRFSGPTAAANFVGSVNACCTFGWGNLSINEVRAGVGYKF
jgi:outer membrane immunogenic protein